MNGVKIKVVSANKDGKIELTKMELENLLNEAYRDGYSDGNYYSGITYVNGVTSNGSYYATDKASCDGILTTCTTDVALLNKTANGTVDTSISSVGTKETVYAIQ